MWENFGTILAHTSLFVKSFPTREQKFLKTHIIQRLFRICGKNSPVRVFVIAIKQHVSAIAWVRERGSRKIRCRFKAKQILSPEWQRILLIAFPHAKNNPFRLLYSIKRTRVGNRHRWCGSHQNQAAIFLQAKLPVSGSTMAISLAP